jgi:hypothetical protein
MDSKPPTIQLTEAEIPVVCALHILGLEPAQIIALQRLAHHRHITTAQLASYMLTNRIYEAIESTPSPN